VVDAPAGCTVALTDAQRHADQVRRRRLRWHALHWLEQQHTPATTGQVGHYLGVGPSVARATLDELLRLQKITKIQARPALWVAGWVEL